MNPTQAHRATPRPVTERWGLVTARDVMRKNVITVSYAAPLSEVERVLSDHRISGVPVTDAAGHIAGVVSLKDLVERYAEDPDARPRRGRGYFHLASEDGPDEDFDAFEVPEEAEETAEDVMTAEVFSVPAGAGIQEIASVMRPPTTGPTADPATPAAAHRAAPRRSSCVAATRSSRQAAMTSAPPIAWRTRAAMRTSSVPASAHPAEPPPTMT